MAKIGRPRKAKGTRVKDQLHVGVRFPEPLASMFRVLVEQANYEAGAPAMVAPETISSVTRSWVAERIREEWAKKSTPMMRGAVERRTGVAVSADGRTVRLVTLDAKTGKRTRNEFPKVPMEELVDEGMFPHSLQDPETVERPKRRKR